MGQSQLLVTNRLFTDQTTSEDLEIERIVKRGSEVESAESKMEMELEKRRQRRRW